MRYHTWFQHQRPPLYVEYWKSCRHSGGKKQFYLQQFHKSFTERNIQFPSPKQTSLSIIEDHFSQMTFYASIPSETFRFKFCTLSSTLLDEKLEDINNQQNQQNWLLLKKVSLWNVQIYTTVFCVYISVILPSVNTEICRWFPFNWLH